MLRPYTFLCLFVIARAKLTYETAFIENILVYVTTRFYALGKRNMLIYFQIFTA